MNWSVDKLDTATINGVANVVTAVHWHLVADDGVNSAIHRRATKLEYNPDNSFVAYESLLEETVLDWLDPDMKNFYESKLLEHLNIHRDRFPEDSGKELQVFVEYVPSIVETSLPW